MALPPFKDLLSANQSKASLGTRNFLSFTSHNSKIQSKRLLLAYLMAMAAIFGTSATGVYLFLTRSLNEEVNHELLVLAKTAAPFLKTAKTQEFQSLVKAVGPSLETVKTQGEKSLNRDLWNHFFQHEYSLEWFDANGKLLAKEGTNFPNLSLAKKFSPPARLNEGSWVIQQQGEFRTLTMPVYSSNRKQKMLRLEGYVRASQSIEKIKEVLSQFRVGLQLGGFTALMLSGISGLCLSKLAARPIKQSFRRLIQFTADASHELRNPLTAIGTTVEVMQSYSEQLNPSDAKKLEIISSATDQLTHLVEDLLFLARTDAIAVDSKLEQTPIPLDEVLEDVVERFELQSQSKRINFQSNLPTGILVRGDPKLLLRLFSNLIENALKYTDEGGKVTLLLDRRRRFAVVCVEDTGLGIPAEYLPFIFQRFWRADKVRCQQKQSVGLGLAIVEAIVERHRGKIKVTSQVGIGSCFRVYLPLAS
ncbi:HAMP domain-containing sensor histidine kinase [Microcoleus sp. herbarium19]|uniref:sensor histidine kinase n=1 Tax=unclassified Microcoleus TaxID=2642155 RepID=UPI002FD625A0